MRAFADHLGVAVRTVSKWEAAGKAIQPRPDMQAVLDTALARADSRAQTRFEQSIEAAPELAVNDWSSRSSWDFESWADDLDRARLHADRLDFQFAARLMHRWLGRVDGAALGDRGLYLKGRSMMGSVTCSAIRATSSVRTARAPLARPPTRLSARYGTSGAWVRPNCSWP